MVIAGPATFLASPVIEPNAAVQPAALPQDHEAANVFEFALPLQPAHKSIADYAPNMKAHLLANPTTMGEEILRSIESLHRRTQASRHSDGPEGPEGGQVVASRTSWSPDTRPEPRAPAASSTGNNGPMAEISRIYEAAEQHMVRTSTRIVEMQLTVTTANQLSSVPEKVMR
ncbi:hypothetical protein [Inquilinus sp. OTU3971]|uniref:hypothetical protein n=1 Tax=Inquilinus sp. OTU3971 TaxID=3043855 RepID=UPI00313B3E35